VLHIVWTERTISRAEIARRTEMSRSTVSNITDELFKTGLLREAGEGRSRGGKPPRLIAFNDDVYGIVGVDMGARHLGVLLTNLRGQIAHRRQVDHNVRDDPEGTISKLIDLIDEAATQLPSGMRKAIAIGVAVPTPLNPSEPDAFSSRVLPKWHGARLIQTLEEAFGTPVFTDNDANLGALAERWWGAGSDGGDLAFIKLGTGIGCGFIIDGNIYRGARFLAGEIGHLAIDPNGPLCDCGRAGCLVGFVGTPALLARNRELEGDETLQHTSAALVAAAERGDKVAARVIAEAADHLAIAVGNLVNLINPATVVFGGGLAGAGDRLLVPVSTALLSRYQWASDAKTRLVVSELGDSGVALGAATAVLAHALTEPSLFGHELSAAR